MEKLTAVEVLEDHVTMAQAYANGQGNPANLAEAESVITGRRSQAPDGYAQGVRDTVTVLFMNNEPLSDRGEYKRTARALESDWWAELNRRGITKDPNS